jgi:glutathione S-transferase
MLALHHNGMSVTSQKVRLTLAEKDLEFESHHLNLRDGDQFADDYRKLNPGAVVPTLIHDGTDGLIVVRESTVIMEYLDEVFPEPPLRPTNATGKATMRLWTKAMDEGVHGAVANLAYATAYRPLMLQKGAEELDTHYARMPDQDRAARQRDVVDNGLASPAIQRNIRLWDKTLGDAEAALGATEWLADDDYSLADIALTPYAYRVDVMGLGDVLLANRPRLVGWLERIKARPNFAIAVTKHLHDGPVQALADAGAEAKQEITRIVKAS